MEGIDIEEIKKHFNLDYIDSKRLEEIVERFKAASWAEKEEIYQKIIN